MHYHHFRKQRIALALVTAPILALTFTTPIFTVSDFPLHWMPFVWIFAIFWISVVWAMNIWLHVWLGKKRWQRYLIAFALVASVAFIGRLVITPPESAKTIPIFVSVLMASSINAVVLMIYELFLLRYSYLKAEQENAELRVSQIESQFQLLKNQLKPHFLFNALSTLKTLIKRQPQQAEAYTVRLADFLRSSLAIDHKRQIPIDEDLQIAVNYLQLQMMRFQDSIIFDNQLPQRWAKHYMVPPFTLQLLFENAIKHTTFSPQQPLQLTVKAIGEKQVEVTNNYNPKQLSESSSHIGLQNLSKQFLLLGSEALSIEQSAQDFKVSFVLLGGEMGGA